ncbi:MAG: UDP-N-acetylmuramoyl-L-alanine--D-glutamate ligase [bacterium]|nr:UDP-N-acetylmuramoyl-L-alanine--D-glutamate ligase [bacterium]
MTLKNLEDKKIAIVGMGVNNKHLAEYFRNKAIPFEIISDWKDQEDLVGKLDRFEIIFRTPGLPYLSIAIQQAKLKGVTIHSQTKLFFDLCPCPIIGVTGTKGKGTTASLISEILNSSRNSKISNLRSQIFLAGNIGQDPFEFLDQISKDDLVVLELSSFQLQDLHSSPHVAVVLKITPEHLDYHKSVEEYIDAKKNIVVHQAKRDFAVINYDNETSRSFAALTDGGVLWNSMMNLVKPGCYVAGEKIFFDSPVPNPPLSTMSSRPNGHQGDGSGGVRVGGSRIEIMEIKDVKLIGRFNLENVTAAITAASCLGPLDPNVIKKVVSEFHGLPHRLEFVSEILGVKFFNDSFSTTPETAMAALSAFDEPVILIAGGSEKNADYTDLAGAVTDSKVKILIPIGITGPKIAKAARSAGFEGRIAEGDFGSMEEIVKKANSAAVSGDIVLLSPASASFDMFKDYKHRGELFRKFVKKLI